MAEDELTQSGIRVGGWLPAVPDGPAGTPPAPAGPRRLPGDPDLPAGPPAGPEPPTAEHGGDAPVVDAVPAHPAVGGSPLVGPVPTGPVPTGPVPTGPGPVGPAPARSSDDGGGIATRGEPASSHLDGAWDGRTPGRHSAPESLRARLADLAGPLTARVRAWSARLPEAARPGPASAPDQPATRVAAARARRRRRRVVLATAALTVTVVALAYAARSPEPPAGRRPGPPAAAPTASTPAPTAAPPTVVPDTGGPALPGGPLLDLDQEPVPPSVSLSLLGTRDWRQWGGTGADSVQRKQRGTGEIEDPGGDRLEHNAGVAALGWTDGTPTARQEGTRAGVFQRGAGKTFTLAVAGSGDLRTVRLFVGAFSAGARLDVSLPGGRDPAVREVALARGDRFYQYVIHFRAPRGQRLLITWRALTVTGGENDGVSLEAVTVS
ncbi:hypothetical protein COO58_01225 [Micromonospora sp. WMMA1996]|uniref:hypothetical protein n=1 Tax=Micromonospora sp. WMMA1996 TaxID=2039878 RepID=UPI000BF65611|nr:hypothetical protein [Micromonospora sp. WMMA1996]PGH46273.1 hypothetical protein COO58_01225 [Micromonospora sp. WMMA1996]